MRPGLEWYFFINESTPKARWSLLTFPLSFIRMLNVTLLGLILYLDILSKV